MDRWHCSSRSCGRVPHLCGRSVPFRPRTTVHAAATATAGQGAASAVVSHPEVLGLAVVAGVMAVGPEGAVMGPLGVAVLAGFGVLLAESVKPPGPTDMTAAVAAAAAAATAVSTDADVAVTRVPTALLGNHIESAAVASQAV